jgi:hypothetical protein
MTEQKDQSTKVLYFSAGIILVFIGILFFLENFIRGLHVGRLWPLFMLIPVAVLVAVWIHGKQKASAVVLPIIILLFYTGYFLWLNYTSWSNVIYTWPNFLIGPGLGFLGLFFTSNKWGFLIPGFILLGLSAIFYTEIVDKTYFLGILLIAAGVLFILKPLIQAAQRKEPKTNE